jgi:hypothetical protein
MHKKNFITALTNAINAHGYWSEQVNTLNDAAQKEYGMKSWKDWHDQAREALRTY